MRFHDGPEAKIWPKLPPIGLGFCSISASYQLLGNPIPLQDSSCMIEVHFETKHKRQNDRILSLFACQLRRCMFEILFDSIKVKILETFIKNSTKIFISSYSYIIRLYFDM